MELGMHHEKVFHSIVSKMDFICITNEQQFTSTYLFLALGMFLQAIFYTPKALLLMLIYGWRSTY